MTDSTQEPTGERLARLEMFKTFSLLVSVPLALAIGAGIGSGYSQAVNARIDIAKLSGLSEKNEKRFEALVNQAALNQTQITSNSASIGKLTKSVQDVTRELAKFAVKMDRYMARLDTMDRKRLLEGVSLVVDEQYTKTDRLRMVCRKQFSTESMIVSRMLQPKLSQPPPEDLPSPLFIDTEPLRGGDDGCYVYLYTMKEGEKHRAEIEKALKGKKVVIGFEAYYTDR